MKSLHIVGLLIGSVLYFSCSMDGSEKNSSGSTDNGGGSSSGKGGSLARFTISGNYLYTVDDNTLRVFDVSTPSAPNKVKETNPGFGVETIFASGNRLYLGTSTGMYIYDVSSPTSPVQKSFYSHIRSCDPVVANDTFAFVTLSTGSGCWSSTNELQVVNIQSASYPYFVESYSMSNPKGLGLDGNTLFVCDQGLKVYDASDVYDLKLQHTFAIDAVDVIPLSGLLLVVGTSGMYEYSYAGGLVTLLSTLRTF